MAFIVFEGLIIPGICGPLGIFLPVRLRARIACAAANGKASLSALNASAGTSHGSIADFVRNLTPAQAIKVMRDNPGLAS